MLSAGHRSPDPIHVLDGELDQTRARGFDVDALDSSSRVAGMGFGVDGSPVDRIRLDVVAIAAADVEPVVGVDATGSRHRGAAGCSGILKSAVDVVWIAIVDPDRVVLRRVDVLEGLPGLTAIVGEIEPAIVALPESLLGVWIEPDRMPAVAASAETLEEYKVNPKFTHTHQ